MARPSTTAPVREQGWTGRVLQLPGSRGLVPVCAALALVVAVAVGVQWTLLARLVVGVV